MPAECTATCAVLRAVIDKIAGQGLDVTVEYQAQPSSQSRLTTGEPELPPIMSLVGDEVERSGEVDLVAAGGLLRRQVEGRLIAEAGGAVVESVEGLVKGGAMFAVIRDSHRRRRKLSRSVKVASGISVLAIDQEAGLAQLSPAGGVHC